MTVATHDFEDSQPVTPEASAVDARLDHQAYALWTRCHQDGRVPSQQDVLGHKDCGFVDHSVLIRIGEDDSSPTISHIGTELWLGLDGILPQDISEVPARSVLSRITEHYLEAVANRTAVGFEAEFENEDGSAIGYCAIALPCSTDGESIDAVLGVVDYSMVENEAPVEPAERGQNYDRRDLSPPMPKEGWRAVIAKMRRDPDEPVADENDDVPVAEEPLVLEPPVEPMAPEPMAPEPDAPGGDKPRKRQALEPLSDDEIAAAAATIEPLPEPASAPAPVEPAPATPSGNAGQGTHAALAQLLEIEGALAAALVEIDSGMPLASAGDAGEIDLDIAVAGNTDVLRAKRKGLRALGVDDRVEDIMITLSSQYHLLRPLSADDSLFLCLVLDSKQATLAMARHELRRVERGLKL